MISNSEKLLAVTTQLIDPDKLHQFAWIVDTHGFISLQDPNLTLM